MFVGWREVEVQKATWRRINRGANAEVFRARVAFGALSGEKGGGSIGGVGVLD
jgi:hypothetical protein